MNGNSEQDTVFQTVVYKEFLPSENTAAAKINQPSNNTT